MHVFIVFTSFSILLSFPSPILYLPNFVSFSFFKIHQVQFVLRIYSWIYGLPLEHSQLSRGCVHSERKPSSPSPGSYLLPVAPLLRVRTSCPLLPMLRVGLDWACRSCTHCHSCCKFTCAAALLNFTAPPNSTSLSLSLPPPPFSWLSKLSSSPWHHSVHLQILLYCLHP